MALLLRKMNFVMSLLCCHHESAGTYVLVPNRMMTTTTKVVGVYRHHTHPSIYLESQKFILPVC